MNSTSDRSAESVHVDLASAAAPLTLHSGASLAEARICFETWGELNEQKTNAVLLFHALSGSQHAAGYLPSQPDAANRWTEEMHAGWWDAFIGPGKAIDTDRYFVICPNFIGGCYGSTGPASIDSETGKPFGGSFPHVSVADQAKVAALLLDTMGISTLHACIGPSVGGLCALSFATMFPERVRIVIPIASGVKTTVLNRLILFEQILAIENDPNFNAGNYYDGTAPVYGLALARMISHKTFVHLDAFESRARGEIIQDSDALAWYQVNDPFQSYMLYQGKKFVERFDANSYLRISDMWSRYDPLAEAGAENYQDLFAPSRKHKQQYLVFSIDSDFCFYPEEQAELVARLRASSIPNMHITVHSDKGHDAFLLEPELFSPHIASVLAAEKEKRTL